MSSYKYSRLPPNDEETFIFDYSSAFTFENKESNGWKYKSAFTYGKGDDSTKLKVPAVSPPTSTDRVARFLVTFGYFIIYIFAFPLLIWCSFKKVADNERLIIFRLGHLHKLKGPGLVFLFPILDRCQKIDIRLKAFSVPPKQIITEDGAIVEVGAEIYFQIVDAEKSVTCVQNLDGSTRILVQTSLCNILAKKSLADIEAERRSIADTVLVNSNKTCKEWGVEITRAELSQIKVLSNPPEKKPPMLVKPPGLFGSDSGEMPQALAQLAASLASSQGQGQTEAITQAIHSMVANYIPNLNSHLTLTPGTNDFVSLLDSSCHGNNQNNHGNNQNKLTPTDHTYTAPRKSSEPSLHESASIAPLAQTSSPKLKPEDVLSLIRMALCERVVEKVQEVYQFEISGEGAGVYYLDLKHGQGYLGEGPDPEGNPAAILSLTFDDLQAMLLSQLKPFQAYMSGRLRVSGDTAAALKLDELGIKIRSMIV